MEQAGKILERILAKQKSQSPLTHLRSNIHHLDIVHSWGWTGTYSSLQSRAGDMQAYEYQEPGIRTMLAIA